MDLADAHRTLEEALAPATTDLEHRKAKAAFRLGLHAGVEALPRFALVLTLGWLAGSFLTGAPLFTPFALPAILCLVPLASALSFRTAARRQGRVDARTAAHIVDRNNQNKDRLSAALELSEDPATADDLERRAALARAAVQDGVDALGRVDVGRTDVAMPELRFRRLAIAIALFIALIPAALHIGAGGPSTDPDAARIAGTDPAGSDADQERAPDADDGAVEPAGAPPSAERRADRDPRDRRADEPRPTEEPQPETDRERQRPRGAGAGAAGTESAGERGQRAPTAGETKSANTGAATASGQGGGGQGAAKSETPPSESDPRDRPPPKPRATQPKRPSETEGGEQEQSAGNPSGPSRGGGRMAAVGNQRSGLDRGSDRDDDPETDDEEIEDEKEETEQRGGVMPMTRDRMRAAGRELSISGNGPPDDGRGGPTPPKKSRGTASLVLGIRLPDQIRGQPNPGTAKTTIEQIPPVPQDEPPRPAAPATSLGPSPNVQSDALPLGDLADVVRRYHELLRSGGTPASATTENTNPNSPSRDE